MLLEVELSLKYPTIIFSFWKTLETKTNNVFLYRTYFLQILIFPTTKQSSTRKNSNHFVHNKYISLICTTWQFLDTIYINSNIYHIQYYTLDTAKNNVKQLKVWVLHNRFSKSITEKLMWCYLYCNYIPHLNITYSFSIPKTLHSTSIFIHIVF